MTGVLVMGLSRCVAVNCSKAAAWAQPTRSPAATPLSLTYPVRRRVTGPVGPALCSTAISALGRTYDALASARREFLPCARGRPGGGRVRLDEAGQGGVVAAEWWWRGGLCGWEGAGRGEGEWETRGRGESGCGWGYCSRWPTGGARSGGGVVGAYEVASGQRPSRSRRPGRSQTTRPLQLPPQGWGVGGQG